MERGGGAHPLLDGMVPYPILSWMEGTRSYHCRGTPLSAGSGIPTGRDLGLVEVLWDGDGVSLGRSCDQLKCCGMRWGACQCEETENITFPILRMQAVVMIGDVVDNSTAIGM